MASKKHPPIVVEKNEGYRTIIEDGVYGGHRPGFFEWVVYTDEIVPDESLSTIPSDPKKVKIKRTLQCRIVATAIEAKQMAEWLNRHIKKYEKTVGKIPTPPKKGKGKKPPTGIVV